MSTAAEPVPRAAPFPAYRSLEDAELSARIEALARRAAQNPAPEIGSETPWTLDEGRLRIRGPSGWVELTPLEFKLARHLMDAKGEIVSRDTLLKAVWGFTLLPKTRTVDHFLGRLRKLFERNPEEPAHFITVRGAGYRFQR
jgi:two-component system alkaline phosphatase synthesis response regulator PhoP